MRYHVIALDYDGTLAEDGKVPQQLKETTRKLVLVTGRELPVERAAKHYPDAAVSKKIVTGYIEEKYAVQE